MKTNHTVKMLKKEISSLEAIYNKALNNPLSEEGLYLFKNAASLRLLEISNAGKLDKFKFNSNFLTNENYRELILDCLDISLKNLDLNKYLTATILRKDIILFFLDPHLNVAFLNIECDLYKAIIDRLFFLAKENKYHLNNETISEVLYLAVTLNYRFYRQNPQIFEQLETFKIPNDYKKILGVNMSF